MIDQDEHFPEEFLENIENTQIQLNNLDFKDPD